MSKQCKESFICLGMWGDFREEEVAEIADGARDLEFCRRKLRQLLLRGQGSMFVMYFILWIIIAVTY